MRALVRLVTAATVGLVAAAVAARARLPRTEDPADSEISVVAIFDGADLRSTARDFRGGAIWAVLGGARVDLRRAEIGDRAHLEVIAVLGGVDLTVPDTWSVVTMGPNLASGVLTEVPAPAEVGPDAPRLSITSRSLLSGVRVVARPVLRAAES